ncbi:MAG: EAL domain-containing protein [Neptunomonas phycophila]|uniref:EAL domain-containing protein n=1 Tax=Neptunomonas phycophila TaxID=1572645 RepID=UPI003B8E9BCF
MDRAEDYHGIDDEMLFSPETQEGNQGQRDVWRVLAVDDDKDFQNSLNFALRDAVILDKPIEVVNVYSMAEACKVLSVDHDFAVAFIDVMMETEDSGLRLMNAVRDILGLSETRFILLTGQPGIAPAKFVMQDFDLTDYCLKSDLASRGIVNILTGAIRNYHQLKTISAAHRGLHLIIESSNRLQTMKTLPDLASATLDELAKLINVPCEGLVCASKTTDIGLTNGSVFEPITIGASGKYRPYVNKGLSELPDGYIQSLIEKSLREKHSVETENSQVLFFAQSTSQAEFAVYVATGRHLEDTEKELLHVFAANASKGFGNVALVSKLDRVAYEDDLLGISNRSALLREMFRIRTCSKADFFNLVMIDIDGFSVLNNLFGSTFGNFVLQAVSNRLHNVFQRPAVVARIQSDLFAVVGFKEIVNLAAAKDAFNEKFIIEQTSYNLSACFTEVSLDNKSRDAADLLRAAESALRRAKLHGPGSSSFHDPKLDQEAVNRFHIMQDFSDAFSQNEFELHFQPQLNMATGALMGVEALIRWNNRSGSVSPDYFIPIAEQSVYIHELGRFVACKTCEFIQQLDAKGYTDITVSINYSVRQFEHSNVISALHEQCALAGISPSRICVEVTETAIMTSHNSVSTLLEQHRKAGGSVSIDDFGTGMSSLEYLFELPVDQLKIDRVFVSKLTADEKSAALSNMIIELSKRLGISVIAEGVETKEQADWLVKHGCELGQGWLYSKALPPEALIDWLAQR